MDRVGVGNWAAFKGIIRDAHDTFNQQTVVWHKSKGGLDRWGEDNATESFDKIPIKGLFYFNAFRTWPVTFTSETGELDRESNVLMLNKRYLAENGWLNVNGKLDYSAAADRFEYRGEIYKDMGYTDISQAQDDPLLIQIILKLDAKATGTNV